MDVETAEAVDTLRADIRRVEREVVRVEISLTATMHELNEDAKHHTDVRIEDVRDDIRILAEGFASLSATVESFRR
jgi:hypothetical protein